MRIVLLLGVLTLCIGMLGMTVCAASDPVCATIEVNTALSGSLPDTPEAFQVEVKADQASNPMPQGAQDGVYTMTLRGAASAKLELRFDRLGVYRYTVRQLPGNNGNCYLDDGVYHITAYVTAGEQNDSMYVSVVLTRDGAADKQDKILFTNRYAAAAKVTLSATNTLDNKTPENGAFTFQLKNNKGEVLQTVKNTGRSIDFDTIYFDREGRFTYTMEQVVGKDSSIIYDKTQYTVVITVTKDSEGNYQTQVTYKAADKEVEGKPLFANKTKSATPQTGDRTNPGFLMLMLLVSGMALVCLWYYDRRSKERFPDGRM